jgi:hypothetical protein
MHKVVAVLLASVWTFSIAPSFCAPETSRPETVEAVIDMYGDEMRETLRPIFAMHNVAYPPKRMTWIGLKQEKLLLLFAPDMIGKMRHIITYPILGTSGVCGPKLREGDKQVPEGFYNISRFRPVVMAHLGMELNYPNPEDKRHAARERRTTLGGDIMIHGSFWSTGCLAMGNEAIEELFVLAHDVKPSNIQIILAPCNLTARAAAVDLKKQPTWVAELYSRLRSELSKYPIPHV